MTNPDSLNMRRLDDEDVTLGRTFSVTKTITDADIYSYAGIIGDFNPIHVNDEYAKPRMGGRIAHGMLTASFMSTLMESWTDLSLRKRICLRKPKPF